MRKEIYSSRGKRKFSGKMKTSSFALRVMRRVSWVAILYCTIQFLFFFHYPNWLQSAHERASRVEFMSLFLSIFFSSCRWVRVEKWLKKKVFSAWKIFSSKSLIKLLLRKDEKVFDPEKSHVVQVSYAIAGYLFILHKIFPTTFSAIWNSATRKETSTEIWDFIR